VKEATNIIAVPYISILLNETGKCIMLSSYFIGLIDLW